MNYYLDIHILPDPEFKETVLMNAIYTKLHKALCDSQSTDIGVSFPNHNLTLGNTLRLHGTAEALDKIQCRNWIGSMSVYCQNSDIQSVPADVKFRTISRQQPTMSAAKLKRLIKRGSITEAEAKNYKAKMFTKGLDNPYVELVSGSNGHRHRRYIEFGSLHDNPVDGDFDQFGLSKTATIPWF
ncbi:CRISPR-associated protein Cas6/Csy4, subtype I-F/YPEST [Methylophaga frappieri]|uniref:CRISPR-associated protein Cas6/Csy4, subtype I-F/YPEST n=1 Tax=Methylophaga frappieri (strain ATCC BAA-2434 / DSM 25690 / JAM7) TaxID=754477 RepID=I1YH06_METFJ|nr:type I-F CRISPR-associated endoribonuclease Cas6/Csy4 [Methylophaga frappieri]AFJ02199.1 CRISPR-associated protein Cas6/Csy4, subtype I-F/YPEST [Methylophaga frappieri]